MDISEALAVVASANLSVEVMLKIGANPPPKALLESAQRAIAAEARRSASFHTEFGDMS